MSAVQTSLRANAAWRWWEIALGVAAVLYELANKLDWLTGGADGLQGVVMGPLLGQFEFDLYGRTAYAYSLVVLALAVVYTIAAGLAGAAGALLAQTTGFASLDVFEFHRSADVMLILVVGGTGWLYGGVAGAIVFKLMQDALSAITPQYWTFWLGLFLVILVMVGRDRLIRPWTWRKKR